MAVLAGSIDELKADLLHSLLPERSQQGLKIKTVVAVIDIWHISGLTLQVIIYHTFLRVITLFLDPMQHPLIMTKSWLTSP